MKEEIKVIGDCAVTRLDKLLVEIEADTAQIVQTNDLPTTVTHYAYARELFDSLKARINAIGKHVDSLSYETLPTMMTNQNVKTISLPDIGRVTVVARWSASMTNKEKGMEWLRETGNDGLIISTVNAQTLGAFAKAETLAGRPLPEEIFKVGAAPYISITKD